MTWNLFDVKTGDIMDSGLNATEVNEIVWIPGTKTKILYINATNEMTPGGVTLWMGDALTPSKKYMPSLLA
jgi:hypothetical protein